MGLAGRGVWLAFALNACLIGATRRIADVFLGIVHTFSHDARLIGKTDRIAGIDDVCVVHTFRVDTCFSFITCGITGSADVCVIDTKLVDTSLRRGTCAITRGRLWNGLARLDGFASVGRISVTVVVSQLADARIIGAEHVIAANGITIATMLTVMHEVGADTGFTARKPRGAAHEAVTVPACFITFA